jgi:hypothetical protein
MSWVRYFFPIYLTLLIRPYFTQVNIRLRKSPSTLILFHADRMHNYFQSVGLRIAEMRRSQ